MDVFKWSNTRLFQHLLIRDRQEYPRDFLESEIIRVCNSQVFAIIPEENWKTR